MKKITLSEIDYEELLKDIEERNRSMLDRYIQEQNKPQLEGKKFLTIKEVSKLLNVTPQTIHRYCKEGYLTKTKLGERSTRLPTDEVLKFLKARKQSRSL